jgi:hypothetical protein
VDKFRGKVAVVTNTSAFKRTDNGTSASDYVSKLASKIDAAGLARVKAVLTPNNLRVTPGTAGVAPH